MGQPSPPRLAKLALDQAHPEPVPEGLKVADGPLPAPGGGVAYIDEVVGQEAEEDDRMATGWLPAPPAREPGVASRGPLDPLSGDFP